MSTKPPIEIPVAESSHSLIPKVRSRSRQIYLRLRQMIILGDLVPLQKLKIAELAEELGANSSAVREALSRLTAEHLVEARDQQGFRVAPISIAELDDLTRTRCDIETLALKRSIERGSKAWAQALKLAHREISNYSGDPQAPEGMALHAQFHKAVLAGCESPALLRIWQSLYEMAERYRAIAVRQAGPSRPVVDEHDRIAKAALDRDVDAAATLLTNHIERTAALVRDAILKASADRGTG